MFAGFWRKEFAKFDQGVGKVIHAVIHGKGVINGSIQGRRCFGQTRPKIVKRMASEINHDGPHGSELREVGAGQNDRGSRV